MKILVTGFGSFLDNNENPSSKILKLLPKSIYGNEIITVELPVVYDQAFNVLRPLIEKYQPKLIINLGLASGRTKISLEQVALNINSSKGADNAGTIFQDSPIIERGENAYFSSLPLRKIVEKLTLKRIPVEISYTAGTYVCNNLMYHVLHYIKENKLRIKAGFVHLPLMRETKLVKDKTTLDLVVMLEGVIEIIKASI